MRNIYILDTSVLIYDPSAYTTFVYSDVIIPIAVLGELDKLKKQASEAGKHARVAVRSLDEISNNAADISTGIVLDKDILLKIDANYLNLTQEPYASLGPPDYGDTSILACALYHYKNCLPDYNVVLVSNDINLRVKAKARGIEAESYERNNLTSVNDIYSGCQIIENEDAAAELQKEGNIDPQCFGINLHPHECVLFVDKEGNNISMARKTSPNCIKLIRKAYPWNISSRNKEQAFAIDLIMDKKIDLVTLTGNAGCGKSIVALAAALELVLNRREYDKLIIYRPIQAVGSDIGYLPGLKSEKIEPWFQAINDNLEVLFATNSGNSKHNSSNDWKRELEMYQKKGRIEMDILTYIRGRSIPNTLILMDEMQNISQDDAKTLLTRAGENTKIILTGDLSQIDNRDLDATNNGLTYVIEKFKDSELAGHITFTKGERSRLATEASEIL